MVADPLGQAANYIPQANANGTNRPFSDNLADALQRRLDRRERTSATLNSQVFTPQQKIFLINAFTDRGPYLLTRLQAGGGQNWSRLSYSSVINLLRNLH